MKKAEKSKSVLVQRLLGILMLVVLVVSSGCAKSPQEQLQKAQQQVSANDIPTAVVTLKNLLQEDPDNLEARLLLAEVSLALNDPFSSEKELERARDLGALPQTYMQQYIDSLLLQNRFTEVLEILSMEASELGLSERQMLLLRGQALLGLDSWIVAEEAFEAVRSMEPEDPFAIWGVAASRVESGRLGSARPLLLELTDQHAEFARGWLLSGQVALKEGRPDDAKDDFEAGLSVLAQKTNFDLESRILVGLVDANLAMRDYDSARASIGQLQEIAPQSMAVQYLTARLYFLTGEYELASNVLAPLLNDQPNNTAFLMLSGSVSLARQDFAQAELAFGQVVARNPDNMAARRLLAASQHRSGASSGALDTLAPLLDDGDAIDSPLSILAGRAFLSSGSPEEAIRVLESAYEDDPDNLEVALNLASAYLAGRRPDDAIRLADSLPVIDDDYQRELILAIGFSAKNEPNKVDRQIESIVARFPDDVDVLMTIGRFYSSYRRVDEAVYYLEQAVALVGADNNARQLLAEAYRAAGQSTEAAAQYKRILADEESNVSALVGLAELSAESGEIDQATDLLTRAAGQDAESPFIQLRLARVLMMQGDLTGAESSALEAASIAPGNGLVQAEVGSILVDGGKQTEGLSYLRKAQELSPESSIVWYQIARAQLSMGESADARASLREALLVDPDSELAGTLLALAELRIGEYQRALDVANDTIARNPNEAGPLSVKAEVLMEMQEFEQATQAYREAYALQPRARLAMRGYLAARQAGLGDPVRDLAQWAADNPSDWGSHNMLGMYYEEVGEYDRAVAAYEQAIESNPENYVALNNLAWRYSVNGDQNAEALAEKAYALQPDSAQVADTLGWIRVREGDYAGGLAVLEEAAALAPNDLNILYHIAFARSRLGDTEGSVAILRQVLESGGQFSERASAEGLLAEIAGGNQ